MKTILVTGASGFVGKHLVELLLQEDHLIVATTSSNTKSITNAKVIWEKCDIQSIEDIQNLFSYYQFDEIYHLAAKAITTDSISKDYYQINTVGTVNILSVLANIKYKGKILLVSTSFVYGDAENNPIKEDDRVNPVNDYAASKAAMEIAALSFINRGLHILIARPFNHTGPHQQDHYVCSDFSRQFAQMKLNKRNNEIIVGNIEVERDFTDVRDIVKGYRELMKSNMSFGVYNLCSGYAIQLKTIIETLEKISDIKVNIKVDQQRLRVNDIQKIYGDYQKINDAIGWKPQIPLEKTIKDLYEYWLEKEKNVEK